MLCKQTVTIAQMIKGHSLDFRPLRKFYPKPVQRTGFCGFSE
ncbi:hypothetical protein SGB_05174 [Shigella boydii ATCC 9905]|nr:hypothetical protein SGB_05174 [Shigella boydii ATCC 9905]